MIKTDPTNINNHALTMEKNKIKNKSCKMNQIFDQSDILFSSDPYDIAEAYTTRLIYSPFKYFLTSAHINGLRNFLNLVYQKIDVKQKISTICIS